MPHMIQYVLLTDGDRHAAPMIERGESAMAGLADIIDKQELDQKIQDRIKQDRQERNLEALMENVDRFGRLRKDGILEISDRDEYLKFLKEINAQESKAQKTAQDRIERVEPGTRIETFTQSDKDGSAQFEGDDVADEKKCYLRTAYDTDGNVMLATKPDGTKVPNQWLQNEDQVRSKSVVPEGKSLAELDGELLDPRGDERHVIVQPDFGPTVQCVAIHPDYNEEIFQHVYPGGAFLINGDGNIAYGIGKVEFEQRHTVLEDVTPSKTMGKFIDPVVSQNLSDIADAIERNDDIGKPPADMPTFNEPNKNVEKDMLKSDESFQ